jgi:AraC-like DNA-binding protein
MAVDFSVMEQHLDAPRPFSGNGKLVLSRLKPGSSVIGALAPSVKLVLEGEEAYQVEGRTIRIRAGEYLYLEPGTDCIGTNRTDTVGLCLMVRPEAVPPEHASLDPAFGRAVPLATSTSGFGRALLDYGRRIARNPKLGLEFGADILACVAEAIAEPLGRSRAAIESLKAAKASTRRDLHLRLERARAHLHENAGRTVTLAEVASVAGLSQFHLARYFQLAFGSPPITYHRELRLSRAADLLAGGASVAQAAEAVGYSDATAFSHAFRRHRGEAPLHWAMRLRG